MEFEKLKIALSNVTAKLEKECKAKIEISIERLTEWNNMVGQALAASEAMGEQESD